MNLNTVSVFLACVLIAPCSSSAPVYTEAPTAVEEISGQQAIVRVMSSGNDNQKSGPVQTNLDLRRQVYSEVASGGVAWVDTYGSSTGTGELDKHSSVVFKTVSIPPPAQLLSPTEKPDRKTSNKPPADANDITSVEFMLKNLGKSVAPEIKQHQSGEYEAAPRASTETESVLAVTSDDLVDPAQARQLAETNRLAANSEIAPLESSFLYVLLCNVGLMPPAKVGLSDDCD